MVVGCPISRRNFSKSGFQSAYDGWYQDANGEWQPVEDSSTAQSAKAANGSVVKSAASAESTEASAASKASSQVLACLIIGYHFRTKYGKRLQIKDQRQSN